MAHTPACRYIIRYVTSYLANPTLTNDIAQPHDHFLKELLSYPEQAATLLRERQWVRGRQKPPPPRCRNGVNSPYLPAYVFLVPGDSRVIAPPGEQLSRPILTDNSWYGCYRLVSLR
uniref:Uncharacterized protein n=1 Tax=Candidatus Kentrum sp. LFY TaxID=2126342 RepID=A0A450X7H6_9GAMM|nr:MAG: hypothetical protein BECKLFY1418C_GA0070996_12303 [Candidatus Kentron sp. LFY]